MEFKKWLLNEDGFADAGGNSWDLIYPTRAGDYSKVSRFPVQHMWLQFRWDRGLELGRTLDNIDNKEFQKRGYVGIESTDMPTTGEKGWKHKKDTGNSSVKPYEMDMMKWIAVGKTADQTKGLEKGTQTRLWTGHEGSTGYEPDVDLSATFGDEGTGKFPEVDPSYMDAPFKKKYE